MNNRPQVHHLFRRCDLKKQQNVSPSWPFLSFFLSLSARSFVIYTLLHYRTHQESRNSYRVSLFDKRVNIFDACKRFFELCVTQMRIRSLAADFRRQVTKRTDKLVCNNKLSARPGFRSQQLLSPMIMFLSVGDWRRQAT